jgi:hypothetical protein
LFSAPLLCSATNTYLSCHSERLAAVFFASPLLDRAARSRGTLRFVRSPLGDADRLDLSILA